MDAQLSVDELIALVTTPAVACLQDDDNYPIPVYNIEERLEAADELARREAKEALPALEQFFVEGVLDLNTSHDSDTKGFHHFFYPSELRRLAQVIVALGGDETFSALMKERVIPALEDKWVSERRWHSESDIQKDRQRLLAILRRDFGGMLPWLGEVG
jgi:hypothetical protein